MSLPRGPCRRHPHACCCAAARRSEALRRPDRKATFITLIPSLAVARGVMAIDWNPHVWRWRHLAWPSPWSCQLARPRCRSCRVGRAKLRHSGGFVCCVQPRETAGAVVRRGSCRESRGILSVHIAVLTVFPGFPMFGTCTADFNATAPGAAARTELAPRSVVRVAEQYTLHMDVHTYHCSQFCTVPCALCVAEATTPTLGREPSSASRDDDTGSRCAIVGSVPPACPTRPVLPLRALTSRSGGETLRATSRF